MTTPNVKKDLDLWLDEVSYQELNSSNYKPTEFALTFMNFIKLVNMSSTDVNKTPPVHLAMLDKLTSNNPYLVNLCHRGLGKSTVWFEYLSFYVAVFGELPRLPNISGMIYVSDTMENGVKTARKSLENTYNHSEFLQEWLPEAKFTDAFIEFKNKTGHQLGIRLFGSQTGIRGTRIYGQRPKLAVLDDLVGDGDANSKASLEAIKDTIYKGVQHALDPRYRRVIFCGTPFNKEDPIIEAVESGAWEVNVWPVCEKFPCSREEFSGSWEDRFSYDFVKDQYELAVKTGQLSSFYQELMLRITSDDERLVQDDEIRWYPRNTLLAKKGLYNFYITTDFATTDKQSSDYSVISVWAYNANGDWFWVDGICKRQTMDHTINDLFRLVSEYGPQQVGIEVSGQQGAFIQWLQQEQINRNIWFNFASSEKSNSPGIRPIQNKLARFNLVVPWFKAGKIYFPEEMKQSTIIGHFMQQIRLATVSGLKGKDDCIDTISMLGFLKPWKPSDAIPPSEYHGSIYADDEVVNEESAMSSYIV